jgi:hypothetical protein
MLLTLAKGRAEMEEQRRAGCADGLGKIQQSTRPWKWICQLKLNIEKLLNFASNHPTSPFIVANTVSIPLHRIRLPLSLLSL